MPELTPKAPIPEQQYAGEDEVITGNDVDVYAGNEIHSVDAKVADPVSTAIPKKVPEFTEKSIRIVL